MVKKSGMVEIKSDGLVAIIETINVIVKSMRLLAEDGIEVMLILSEVNVDELGTEIKWFLKKVDK